MFDFRRLRGQWTMAQALRRVIAMLRWVGFPASVRITGRRLSLGLDACDPGCMFELSGKPCSS